MNLIMSPYRTTLTELITTIGGWGMEELFNIAIKETQNNYEELHAILKGRSREIFLTLIFVWKFYLWKMMS